MEQYSQEIILVPLTALSLMSSKLDPLPIRSKLKLLFLSTPVGPLGSGLGGGVELTLTNLIQEFQQRGHSLQIVAPENSVSINSSLVAIAGELQPTAHTQGRASPIIMPTNSALAGIWNYARQVQQDYDLLVNFAYDWLPFYLTPFFSRSIAHFVSMGSLTTAMDQVIHRVALERPSTIGVYTQTQAETFPFAEYCRPLGSAVDLTLYQFCDQPGPWLVWLGRISPEKGLEDAVAAAQRSQTPLKILGKLEDKDYWRQICEDYADAPMEYLGFLPTVELQKIVRQCRALLMTPRWVEAFGNVAIEALACGVPVITYRRGGPAEVVQDGKTGWLVEPDSVEGLVAAIARIDQLSRRACRQQAEADYSLTAWGDRFEQWFRDILTSRD